MIQELFRIGPLSISPFGVMLVAAFLAAFFQLRRGMKQLGVGDDDDASAIVFAAGVGGIVGAKIYYAILHGDWRLLLDRSGLVWYGGFLLGTAAVIWTMRRRRLPAWPTADAAAPALALGYGIGRDRLLPGRRRLRPPDRPAVGGRVRQRPAADHRRLPAPRLRPRSAGIGGRHDPPPRAPDAALRDGAGAGDLARRPVRCCAARVRRGAYRARRSSRCSPSSASASSSCAPRTTGSSAR